MKIDGTRSHDRASELVLDYYAALNRHDIDGVLALLTEDVVHELNQGPREVGRAAFAAFLQRVEACYHEQLRDVVVMSSPDKAPQRSNCSMPAACLATTRPATACPATACSTR